MLNLLRLVKRPFHFLPVPLARLMATKPSAEWTTVTNSSGVPVYYSYTQPIAKSLLDNREYRYIRLPNQLEALLVSDSETDKAAAALDVGVGHLTDPVRRVHACVYPRAASP